MQISLSLTWTSSKLLPFESAKETGLCTASTIKTPGLIRLNLFFNPAVSGTKSVLVSTKISALLRLLSGSRKIPRGIILLLPKGLSALIKTTS
jgi:hypothetical protein